MSEFDDDRMERLLGAAGGAFPDVNTAYAQVQGRVRHIKRRRAMVASTAACVLLAAGAAAAIGSTGQRSNLQPGDHGSLSVDSTEVESSVSSVPSDVTPTTGDSSGSDTSTTLQGSSNDSGSNIPPGSTTPTTAATTATTATTNLPPVSIGSVGHRFTSIGGSVTVNLQLGALVLVSATPNAGFVIDQQSSSSDRVEVRFRSATHESRIRLDIVGTNVQPTIEEK